MDSSQQSSSQQSSSQQYEDSEMIDESCSLPSNHEFLLPLLEELVPKPDGSTCTLSITYDTRAEEVCIMGEFNNWAIEIMAKSESTVRPEFSRFTYEAQVPAGYKYRYVYIVDGDMRVNRAEPNDISKVGRHTNYKFGTHNTVDLNELGELLPPLLSKVPSYTHPATVDQNKKMYLELRQKIFDQLSSRSNSYEEEVKDSQMLQLTKSLSKLSSSSIDRLITIKERLARNRECLNQLTELRKLLDEAPKQNPDDVPKM